MLLVTLGLAIVIENALLLCLPRRHAHRSTCLTAFQTIDLGFAFLPCRASIAFRGGLRRRAAAVGDPDADRHRQGDPRGRQGKARRRLVGIDVAHVYAVTFGLGTACVAVAACLLIPTYYVNPHVGNAFVLVAFTIVVLGGMGSVPGALIGGLIIGVVESLCGLFSASCSARSAFS